MHSNASYKVLKYFGGTNSRRAAGHAGALVFFVLGNSTQSRAPRGALVSLVGLFSPVVESFLRPDATKPGRFPSCTRRPRGKKQSSRNSHLLTNNGGGALGAGGAEDCVATEGCWLWFFGGKGGVGCVVRGST